MFQIGPLATFVCKCSKPFGTVHQGEGHRVVLLTLWMPKKQGMPTVGILHLSLADGPFHDRMEAYREYNIT